VTLLAFAAVARAVLPLLVGTSCLPCPAPPLLIDISRPHGTQQQTHHMLRRGPNDGTRTDGWILDHFREPVIMRAIQ